MGGKPIVDNENWGDFVQNWESIQANPLDGYSPYGLFEEPELLTKEEEMVEELHSFVPPMAFDESSCGPFKDSYHTGHEEYVAFDTNHFTQVPEGYNKQGGMGDVCHLDGVMLPLLWKDDHAQPMIETRKAKESLVDIWIEDPDMKQKMEEIKKGKRKVGEDIWGSNQGLWNETEEEFYEKIEAPKVVDFTAPDPYRPDDRYWFCLRVGNWITSYFAILGFALSEKRWAKPYFGAYEKLFSLEFVSDLIHESAPSLTGVGYLIVVWTIPIISVVDVYHHNPREVDLLKEKIDISSLFARDGDYDLASVGRHLYKIKMDKQSSKTKEARWPRLLNARTNSKGSATCHLLWSSPNLKLGGGIVIVIVIVVITPLTGRPSVTRIRN
ncbi:hypothetical protein RHGRI_011064 [Rhododendron griersonianum]|uniref:Uncharacterized protein n=1 Tax=Rhododendron griersonianum TaxID=479676 RepID=A0AAV6KLH6_9ERIC|nr:hypothetical protein RHGRI_011064 [Rhododendron griersonianum]